MQAVARLKISTINANKYSTVLLLYITSNMSNLIITIGVSALQSSAYIESASRSAYLAKA